VVEGPRFALRLAEAPGDGLVVPVVPADEARRRRGHPEAADFLLLVDVPQDDLVTGVAGHGEQLAVRGDRRREERGHLRRPPVEALGLVLLGVEEGHGGRGGRGRAVVPAGGGGDHLVGGAEKVDVAAGAPAFQLRLERFPVEGVRLLLVVRRVDRDPLVVEDGNL
jgi:hypothetical protein